MAEWCLGFAGVSLLGDGEHQYVLAKLFHRYTMKYPDKAYGLRYVDWVMTYDEMGIAPKAPPSLGNGCAMRVSPVAYAYDTLEEVEHYAEVTAKVTHNNPEAVRGACAIAAATKLALDGHSKEEIKSYIEKHYYYDLSPSLESAKSEPGEFVATCPVTVPQALIAFLHGKDYRDTIQKAIEMDGDCDTISAMAGSIAYAYWKEIPGDLLEHCCQRLDKELLELWYRFDERFCK